MKTQKTYRGEKYIYLLMGYTLAKMNNNATTIGKDDGFKGDYAQVRTFAIREFEGKTLLHEIKMSSNFADFRRVFEIINPESLSPIIKDYVDSYNDNYGQDWYH